MFVVYHYLTLDSLGISSLFEMATEEAATATPVRYRTLDMESDHDADVRVDFLPNPYAIVRFGMVTQRDAEKVWADTLDDWGVGESSKAERDELDNYVTAALIQSTSKDTENLETSWILRGKEMKLRSLYDNMALYAQSNNDSRLRTFVRSYRRGYFVVRQYQVLSDPANAEWRNMLAMRTGDSPELARFMFDTADFLPQAGVKLNTDEIRLVKHYRGMRTQAAQISANQVGEVAPRNDKTARSADYGAGRAVSQATRPSTQSVDHRTNMMGLGLK